MVGERASGGRNNYYLVHVSHPQREDQGPSESYIGLTALQLSARGRWEEAAKLSSVLPVILEQNDFEEVYSDSQWTKLKQGTLIWHVKWDSSKLNGLGDISVQPVDGGFKFNPLELPPGEKKTDEFFGEVETYRGDVTAVLTGAAAVSTRLYNAATALGRSVQVGLQMRSFDAACRMVA